MRSRFWLAVSITGLMCSLAGLALSICGCSSPSKCAAGDVPEVTQYATAPDGVAQNTKGGQDVRNGADAKDVTRVAPKITTGTGSGANSSSSADQETRHTTSGGALANMVNGATDPVAFGGGGGKSAATVSAEKNVDAIRTALTVHLATHPEDAVTRDALLKALSDAQAILAQTSVNDRANVTNNYYQQNQRNVLTSFSSSSTDGEAGGAATGGANVAPKVAAAAAMGKVGEKAMEAPQPVPEPPPAPSPEPAPVAPSK